MTKYVFLYYFFIHRPCFQLRKTNTGEALTPKATLTTFRSIGVPLQRVLQQHQVHNITTCGRNNSVIHSGAQYALLVVAGALSVAGVIAAVVLCCLHSTGELCMCFEYCILFHYEDIAHFLYNLLPKQHNNCRRVLLFSLVSIHKTLKLQFI